MFAHDSKAYPDSTHRCFRLDGGFAMRWTRMLEFDLLNYVALKKLTETLTLLGFRVKRHPKDDINQPPSNPQLLEHRGNLR